MSPPPLLFPILTYTRSTAKVKNLSRIQTKRWNDRIILLVVHNAYTWHKSFGTNAKGFSRQPCGSVLTLLGAHSLMARGVMIEKNLPRGQKRNGLWESRGPHRLGFVHDKYSERYPLPVPKPLSKCGSALAAFTPFGYGEDHVCSS